ncbi:hypothetical protein DXG01_014760 [Tephrocybe rancida]|nr:hypothetical protein DXG01_014760 [Tephrocybe rancida]
MSQSYGIGYAYVDYFYYVLFPFLIYLLYIKATLNPSAAKCQADILVGSAHPPRRTPSIVTKNPSPESVPEDDNRPSLENSTQTTPVTPIPPEIITVKRYIIIGINEYRDPCIPNLRGAVNDANAVVEFLVSEVGLSEDRIVNLRDEVATRKEILMALRGLARNCAISEQDPILIYYAGHGSEVPLAGVWKPSSPNSMTQMLIPHDFGFEPSNDDDHGQGIFDITLSRILSDIASKKSDNITLIIDCCYSSFGTQKNTHDETLNVRGIDLTPSYTISANLLRSEVQGSSAYDCISLSSHVLLAACKDQPAMERQGHGAFTSALLNLLKQEGIDKLAYTDVITHMPDLSLQNPRYEGVKKDCILFNSKVHDRHLTMYRIESIPGTPNEYILQAGEAHGVTKGAKFAIYPDRAITPALGSVVTFDTTPFSCRCSVVGDTSFALSQNAYAIQTRVGERPDIRLFIEPNDAFLDLFRRLGEEMQRSHADPSKRSFYLVDDAHEQPDIIIRTHGGLVQFEVKDLISRQYGFTHMPFNNIRPNESGHILSILRSAADFYRHLHQSNKDSSLTQKVHVECLKLEPSGELTDDLLEIFVPKQNTKNLIIGGTIFIDVDDSAVYGYRISNASETPLFVALFYFDISDLSVGNCLANSFCDVMLTEVF